MVNFKNLVKKRQDVDPADLIKLFESLDRQTSHTELRPAQQQAVQELTSRRKERDLILKISTGAGKTIAGLLYLQSHMEEKKRPAVYLCPTNQLVEQVKEEALKLGINAVIYPGGEPHPSADGTAAKAIIVCTYDKLFNAKTTFDRTDVRLRPCAMVLDDAHAGVEEIRDAFTLRIVEGAIHNKILKLMDSACEKFNAGLWSAIVNGDPKATMEVPCWIWQPLVSEIQRILAKNAEDESLIFVWPYLRDILRWCRCIISGRGIEIVPDVIPIYKSQAFDDADHRLFMSATLADDSVLIRELGCAASAARNPILPKADKGLGERMVLAPALVDKKLDRKWVMDVCSKLAKKVRVVVLSPSEASAREWEQYGAKVVLKDQVTSAVATLKNASSGLNFFVFVQRYDGVDLPDNACRILVLDGMPYGEGIVDQYDSSLSSSAGGIRNRLIYRIEQGMGRAVRSHVDYAVVILAGADLANFIARKEVLDSMNADTKAQLELALTLATLAIEEKEDGPEKALIDMLVQCLKRDQGWKQYYDANVRKDEHRKGSAPDEPRIVIAEAERQAFQFAISNNLVKSVETLRAAIAKALKSEKEIGWYLQKMANYMYDINPAEALEVQRAANEKNHTVICPPASVMRRPVMPGKLDTPLTILNWFKQFGNPNGAIAAIQDLRARLSFEGSPKTIEQALMDLAFLLGAKGSRPEQELNEGPDDLWLWPGISLVIEAKNENESTLHKRDAAQLLNSLEWFKRNHPTRPAAIPIIVAKVSDGDTGSVFPNGTRIITPTKMAALLEKVEKFYQFLIGELPFTDAKGIAVLQPKFELSPEQFVNKYTVPLKELPRTKAIKSIS